MFHVINFTKNDGKWSGIHPSWELPYLNWLASRSLLVWGFCCVFCHSFLLPCGALRVLWSYEFGCHILTNLIFEMSSLYDYRVSSRVDDLHYLFRIVYKYFPFSSSTMLAQGCFFHIHLFCIILGISWKWFFAYDLSSHGSCWLVYGAFLLIEL